MQRDEYNNIDRRLTLAFGLLILGLLLSIMLSTALYYHKTLEREQDRLASLAISMLVDSLGKVSFSGTHRVRLLVEELKDKYQGIAYIRLLDTEGHVVAASGVRQDVLADPADRRFFYSLLQQPEDVKIRQLTSKDERLREVGMGYRGGFDNRLQGVLLLGITETSMHKALIRGLMYVLLVMVLLLLIGMVATYRISRHFAEPVRRLAHQRAEGQQRLSYVLDAIDCAIWEWDLVNERVILDEHWAEMLGYRLKELEPITVKTSQKLTHPDDAAANAERARAHLEGRTERFISETRVRHKNGEWIWVRDNGVVTERDAHGRPLRMIGARQDITARKRVESTALKESERFKALIKASDTGAWEWDARKQELWCGAEYFSMLGYDKREFADTTELQKVWTNLLHPDDRAEASRKFADYVAGDTIQLYENEFRMRHADGSWVWISSRGRTLPDAEGKPTALTVGAHINISTLKEAQASLRESQQRLQLISDSIPDSMVYRVECGLNGEYRRFSYISRGVEQLHGITAEQAIDDAQLVYEQFIIDQDSMRIYEAECIAEMKTFRMEAEIIRPDGEHRWMLLISSPRRLPDGLLVFDGIELDITERRQQEQKIRELNATLEKRVEERTAELSSTLENLKRAQEELLQREKLASLGALVAGVAHELNTPIGNALMVATSFEPACKKLDTALQGGLTRSALQGFLDEIREGSLIIERNLARSAELIGSFKQLAVDQTSYQRRPFELKELAHEVLTTLRPTLRKMPFVLRDELCENVRLDSYPGPLGQVLINLVNNALTHAFAGRQEGVIWLRGHIEEGMVHVSVSDDGIGMMPEQLKKIFDPFYTTQLGKGGSGLGLHIVYTLVNGLLGGRIEVRSTPGSGTCFTLILPRVAP